jgi:CspA family cold shock protein
VVDAVVKWFNAEKGFGFVEIADGSGDAFLHIGVLQNAGHDTVAPETKLRVQVGQGHKGRQVTAVLELDTSTAASRPRMSPNVGRREVQPRHSFQVPRHGEWFNGQGLRLCRRRGRRQDVFRISIVERAGIQAPRQQVWMRVVETEGSRGDFGALMD